MSAIFGETLTFEQQNGPSIQLVAFGDEHYHRLETTSGFTVVYDAGLGRYCYAKVANERFASTAVPVDRPPPPGLKRHLREPLPVRRGTGDARRRNRLPPPDGHAGVARVFGANRGLLPGRQLSVGTVKGLTILVNFKDVKSTATAADVDRMLNGAAYAENGNFCSVREYFRLMSAGKLDYTNVVVGPFQLKENRASYFESSPVHEALDLAVASGLDLKQFDSRHEGIVDVLCVLYAGQTQYQGELWPHNGFKEIRYGAIRTGLYLVSSLGRSAADLTIGTFCHESGHLVCRFADLYDYGERDDDSGASAGLGVYCLMAAGNHLDGGRTPAPICGYQRDLAGWCETIDLRTPGVFEAVHGDYGKVLKFTCPDAPNESFIVENRSSLALDEHLPASGLAVLHCDTLGSNEWQEGTPARHYQCALLQADGRQDLERDLNEGDGGDLFARTKGTALSDATRPTSRQWDGTESGFVLGDIGSPGQKIAFRTGARTVPAKPTAVKGEFAGPAVRIPDGDPAGVSSAIPLDDPGVTRRIVVKVDIDHSYVGDLRVELLSPKGSRAILHRRLGGGKDDLVATYDSRKVGSALRALVGQPIGGAWVLRVTDLAARHKGKLRRWSIEIEPAT